MIGIMAALRLRKLLRNRKIDPNSPTSLMNVGQEEEPQSRPSPLLGMFSQLLGGDPVDDELVNDFTRKDRNRRRQ